MLGGRAAGATGHAFVDSIMILMILMMILMILMMILMILMMILMILRARRQCNAGHSVRQWSRAWRRRTGMRTEGGNQWISANPTM